MRGSVTRAAEGFDRRAFTVDEVLRMQEAGIISEDENFELIEGEIVPMQAKTHGTGYANSGASMRRNGEPGFTRVRRATAGAA